MSEAKSELLAYVKSCDVQILRRKHRIGFHCNNTASDLIEKLKAVPPLATVDEVLHHGEDDAIVTIEFHEEKAKTR